VSPP
jgi:hypothetical protein